MESQHKCVYCSEPLGGVGQKWWTREHLIPKIRGGSNLAVNIRKCCRRCNSDKGGKLPNEYLEVLIRRRDLCVDEESRNLFDIKIANCREVVEYVELMGDKLYKSADARCIAEKIHTALNGKFGIEVKYGKRLVPKNPSMEKFAQELNVKGAWDYW